MLKNEQQTLIKILSRREEKRRDKVHEIWGVQLLDSPTLFLLFLRSQEGCLLFFMEAREAVLHPLGHGEVFHGEEGVGVRN